MPHTAVPPNLPDTGLNCLIKVARLLGMDAQTESLRQRFSTLGRPADVGIITSSAKYLGINTQVITIDCARLQQVSLPALAQCRDGHWVVVVKVDAESVQVDDPLEANPLTLTSAHFESIWNGTVILLTCHAAAASDQARFGLRWFVPALSRSSALFGEVMRASFFLQLFALVAPLLLQLSIDKVLVQQGLTTLELLLCGLLVVSVFDVLLNGLRSYVFRYTTRRMDRDLGARLYHHLLGVPMNYFTVCPMENPVTPVRELETIRDFITGAGLTVIIDLCFAFAFLTVMYYYSPLLTAIVLISVPFYVCASFAASYLGNMANQLAGLINKLLVILILWVGAHAVVRGELSIGQLIAFGMLAARISSPVLRLVQLRRDFQQAGVAIEQLAEVVEGPPDPTCE